MNWRAAASTSSSVAGGSRPRSSVMLRHMRPILGRSRPWAPAVHLEARRTAVAEPRPNRADLARFRVAPLRRHEDPAVVKEGAEAAFHLVADAARPGRGGGRPSSG